MLDPSPFWLPLGFHDWLPGAQAVTLGLLTFLQEDAPTVGAALLAAAGSLSWQAGFLGCFLGIWIGDALLYLLARGVGRPLLQRSWAKRFFDPAAVARSERWFAAKGPWLLLSSRFVPGTRLPTYLAAGFLRLPFGQFLLVTGTAVVVWTTGIFLLARALGPELLNGLRRWNSGGLAIALLIVGFVVAIRLSGKLYPFSVAANVRSRAGFSGGNEIDPSAQPPASPSRDLTVAATPITYGKFAQRTRHRIRAALGRCTRWEFWPAWLFYIPVAANYVWLAIRYRGFTLPTAANPGMFSGGFVGESKIATLQDLHATSPEFTAEARLLEGATAADRLASLERIRGQCRIDYPFILKPDVGQRGVGVKLIRTSEQAEAVLRSTSAPLLVQRYAPGPHEAGVFYYRFPHEPSGRIFAITEKVFPVITGDGQRTIEELVWQDRRARFAAGKYFQRLGERLSEVLPAGESLKLVEAGNHAQGCIFRDGAHLWSEALERRIDEISKRLDGFYIGRYDIRYSAEDELRAGRNFQIIELNGAASEATSIYDARNSLFAAYRTLFRQWELVFAIGAANRRRGSSPTNFSSLWRKWRETTALVSTYPLAD